MKALWSSCGATLGLFLLCHCGSDPEGSASSGSGGTSGGGDAADGSVSDGCPTGRGKMVRVDIEGELPFCIDATETTVADYQAFLAANLAPAQTSYDFCGANSGYAPDESCLAENDPCTGTDCERWPRTCVDACDALDYCRWAGKELCGSMAGGIEFAEDATKYPRTVAACAGSARPANYSRDFPYGIGYDANACNGGSRAPRAVGAQPACRTEESAQLLDLVGNVSDMTAVFSRQAAGALGLIATGGDYTEFTTDGCKDAFLIGTLSAAYPNVGLRCCATPAP